MFVYKISMGCLRQAMNYKLCDVCDHAIPQQLHIVKRTGSNEKR